MVNKEKFVLPTIIALLAVIVGLFAFVSNVRPAGASAPVYESNYSTTTRSTDASATYSSRVCTGSCQIASIIIVQPATAGYLRFWDATTTATSTIQSDVASSTASLTLGKAIARVLSASDVFGFLQIDATMNNGIVLETSTGFDGEYIITWKK